MPTGLRTTNIVPRPLLCHSPTLRYTLIPQITSSVHIKDFTLLHSIFPLTALAFRKHPFLSPAQTSHPSFSSLSPPALVSFCTRSAPASVPTIRVSGYPQYLSQVLSRHDHHVNCVSDSPTQAIGFQPPSAMLISDGNSGKSSPNFLLVISGASSPKKISHETLAPPPFFRLRCPANLFPPPNLVPQLPFPDPYHRYFVFYAFLTKHQTQVPFLPIHLLRIPSSLTWPPPFAHKDCEPWQSS